MTTGELRQRLRRPPPITVDAAMAAGLALAMTLTISVAEEPGSRAPNLLAYLLGLAVAALLPVRRLWPMGALIGSVGVLFLYFGLDYPAFSPAVPLAAAAYFAAAAGRIVPAATLIAGVEIFAVGWQTVGENQSLLSPVGTSTLADSALLAAVLLLGEAVRSRRAWAEEVRARLQRAEADREREADRRVQEERLRFARDLHDVMAHTIAALNVQAGVAADVIDDAPEQAKASLRTIREQSRAAMVELEATLGLLRSGAADAPRAPARGLKSLGELVQVAVSAGVEVDVTVAGAVRPVPRAVELTAYRIVQESLTNVVRHARATAATVRLSYDPDALVVRVCDDGAGAGDCVDGHGLVGMRERASALGGTLDAGPASAGGFRVRAWLPTTTTGAR